MFHLQYGVQRASNNKNKRKKEIKINQIYVNMSKVKERIK